MITVKSVMTAMAGLSLMAAPIANANVTGKVTFKGAAPKAEPIKMSSDAACEKQYAGKKPTKDDVVVNSNGTLANVFVYVKEGVNKATVPAAPTEPVKFDQKGCMYTPKVFGVRVNQPIEIHNSDPMMHNVHAMPKAGNASFNNGMPPKGAAIKKTFTKPELGLRIKCDVHGWMLSFANVMEHPYFAVSDDKGAFTIANLPPGEYTLEAWHEKYGTKTQKVTVAAGATPAVEFTYSPTATN